MKAWIIHMMDPPLWDWHGLSLCGKYTERHLLSADWEEVTCKACLKKRVK